MYKLINGIHISPNILQFQQRQYASFHWLHCWRMFLAIFRNRNLHHFNSSLSWHIAIYYNLVAALSLVDSIDTEQPSNSIPTKSERAHGPNLPSFSQTASLKTRTLMLFSIARMAPEFITPAAVSATEYQDIILSDESWVHLTLSLYFCRGITFYFLTGASILIYICRQSPFCHERSSEKSKAPKRNRSVTTWLAMIYNTPLQQGITEKR